MNGNYKDELERLSRILPGYSQLSRNLGGNVGITRIDFRANGYGRVDVYDHAPRSNISRFLTRDMDSITTRYILVEDITSDAWLLLGSTFNLDPQFFIDHMSGQVPGLSPGEANQKAKWSTWGLPKPYMSFRWYRPVARSNIRNAAMKRKQMEEQYTRVIHRSVTKSQWETQDTYNINVIRSVSNILRSEWDFPAASKSTKTSAGLIAIEERVSIYQVERYGHQYVIMLLDPIPKVSEASWEVTDTAPAKPYTPPPDAEYILSELYEPLVPRFTPNFTSGGVRGLDDDSLQKMYETLFPTMGCLLDSSHPANQTGDGASGPCGHFPLVHLFQIVVSDTLALLQVLDTIQSDIIQSTGSQEAELEDILVGRAFLAKLHSQLPPLSRELQQALKKLLQQGNGTTAHHESSEQLSSQFETTIEKLKEASSAISGTLQFMESHRAILEAEGITRLTELAFLFIPLSFAASLFSMQIQELNNPVPLRNFIAFAISLSASTYFLRLLARSSWVHRQKQAMVASIRERSSVPPGAPIPNMAYIAWLHARTGPAVILIIFVACLLVPVLVVLWTRQLETGLKIGLTFMFLIIVFFTIWAATLTAPTIRKGLRDGFQTRWYNAAEEQREPNARDSAESWMLKWASGRR